MGEFAPPGSNARMTPAQVRKYVKDMKAAQALAEEKLKAAQDSDEATKEALKLKELEEELDDL